MRTKYLMIALGLLGTLFIYGYLIEPFWISINFQTIHSKKLTRALKGMKIIQISDLHIKKFGLRETRTIGILKKLQPDIIFITGDHVAWGADFDPVIDFFQKVPAKIGIWAVLGNADYSNSKGMCVLCHEPRSKNLKQNSPITFLRNSAETVVLNNKNPRSSKLAIIGVDDPITKRHNLQTACNNLPEEIPKLLLSHSPEIIDDAVHKNIDLVLAGHTHGGQILLVSWLKNCLTWLGFRNPRFIGGYYKLSNTSMYVNRGIGTSVLPIRLGVRPEITVIQFEWR